MAQDTKTAAGAADSQQKYLAYRNHCAELCITPVAYVRWLEVQA